MFGGTKRSRHIATSDFNHEYSEFWLNLAFQSRRGNRLWRKNVSTEKLEMLMKVHPLFVQYTREFIIQKRNIIRAFVRINACEQIFHKPLKHMKNEDFVRLQNSYCYIFKLKLLCQSFDLAKIAERCCPNDEIKLKWIFNSNQWFNKILLNTYHLFTIDVIYSQILLRPPNKHQNSVHAPTIRIIRYEIQIWLFCNTIIA